MAALGAVRVVGGEGLLGQDVQAGEQPQRLVEVEVVDVAAALLVQQLQRQQAQQGADGGDHPRAGVAAPGDQVVEAEPGQQGQEEEDAGDASPHASAGDEPRLAAVGDLRGPAAERGGSIPVAGGPADAGLPKKGGTPPVRTWARKSRTRDRTVEGRQAELAEMSAWSRRSTKKARRTS